jgi:hypothetical protein
LEDRKMPFVGTFEVILEEDGRVYITEVAKSVRDFRVSFCADGCVTLTPALETPCNCKARFGRVLIPIDLRKKAGLAAGKVIIVGCNTCIEIWNKDKFSSELGIIKGEINA